MPHNETQQPQKKERNSYPQRRENKRELLKASNETQTPQKKERKKLSPEARKQTRASESFKWNAKKNEKKSTWANCKRASAKYKIVKPKMSLEGHFWNVPPAKYKMRSIKD